LKQILKLAALINDDRIKICLLNLRMAYGCFGTDLPLLVVTGKVITGASGGAGFMAGLLE
jgi:hypothetical protein